MSCDRSNFEIDQSNPDVSVADDQSEVILALAGRQGRKAGESGLLISNTRTYVHLYTYIDVYICFHALQSRAIIIY